MTTKKEDSNVKGMIASLEAQKAKLDAAIASLKALDGMDIQVSAPLISKHHGEPTISSDTFYGKTFVEAVVEYLGMTGSKQPTDKILKSVRQGGIKIMDGSAGTILRKRAQRKKDIVRVGRGEWGLQSWYNR